MISIITNAWNRVIMLFCTGSTFDKEFCETVEPYPATVRLFYWEIAMILLIGLLIALPGSLNKFALWPIVFVAVWLDALRNIRRTTPMWKQEKLWEHSNHMAIFWLLTLGNLKFAVLSFFLSWGLTYLDLHFINGSL
jgi:hypothetical protein